MPRSDAAGPDRAATPPSDIRGRITHDLGVAIVSGALAPGTALLGEERFSVEHNVSRGAYREAIRILAAKGLVHSRTRSGTRVTPRDQWSLLDPEVLGWMAQSGVDHGFVASVFELRGIVEPAATALAAIRRTDDQLTRMTAALDAMARHGLMCREGREADQAFHRVVLEAAGNAPLMTLATSISAAIEWTTRLSRDSGRQTRDPMPDHRAVLAAIATRDAAGAQAAMRRLIDNARGDAPIAGI